MKKFTFKKFTVTINVIAILFLITTGFLIQKGEVVEDSGNITAAGFSLYQNSHGNPSWTKCGFDEYLEAMKNEDAGFSDRINAFEEFVTQFKQQGNYTDGQVITIPVVVHVVWNQPVQNISFAQIQSQIDVLNEDFRRRNADTTNTPIPFRTVAADSEIEFKLAVRDPSGNPTLGITRTQTSVTSFPVGSQIKFTSQGGKDAWPSSSYMNVWTAPAINNNVLGFATFPGGNPTIDGIVVGYNYFGREGVLSAPFNKGRTATHEVGHWLSLYHIWGDTFCGNDLVNDTPTQQTENYGCPGFPHRPNSCGQTNPDGDMFMNYMDYTDDACMNIYTLGQKNRMIATLNGPRVSILSSQGLTPAEGQPIALFDASSRNVLYGSTVDFMDDSRGIPTSWNWSFPGGTPSTSTAQNPAVTYSTPGRYDVQLIVSNSFGSDTLFAENYITARGAAMTPITLTAPPSLTSFPVSPNDLHTLHTFDWTSAGSDPLINYEFKIRRGGTPVTSNLSFQSDSNGVASQFTIRNRELDSLAAIFGTVGDSTICIWSATAFNGLDSISSGTFIVILKRTTVGITITSQEIPGEFALRNNYPNPFNPVTKISFDIPELAQTRLTIYDINGREITKLVNEQLTPGSYEYSFDAAELSSGVYFYRLEAGSFIQSKRMLLLK